MSYRNHNNNNKNGLIDPYSNPYMIPYFHKKIILKILLILLILFNTCIYSSINCFIIFANRKDIRKLDETSLQQISSSFSSSSSSLSSSTYHHRNKFLNNENSNSNYINITILIDNLEDATAIDFDYELNLLFWTDLGLETIKSLNLTDRTITDVINTGIESPESLACDWITKKLYWIDSETKHIDVSNYDGTQRTVLFWKDLDQPRTIVLVPKEGLMFWSDWGEIAKIERASMDGDPKSRKIIIENDLTWPNGLTVDYKNSRLYFADANRKYIASCDFNGKNLEKILSNVSQIFALTINENLLYWTLIQNNLQQNGLKKNGIYYYDKILKKLGQPYYRYDQSPLGITIFNEKRQPKSSNPCAENNGGCSHLCLLSSSSNNNKKSSTGYSCACPTGIKLESDGKTCPIMAHNILLLARKFDIRRISLDTNDYTPVVLPIKNLKQVVAIDYDPVEEKVYWADDELHAIKRATLNGSNYETVVSTEIVFPEGLAIDWISRNIYWIDSAIDHIEVAKLDSSYRKVLINTNIDKPRAIVIHPLEGFMFWTDWGNQSKIERASLDGTDRLEIINTSITWPNGLAIDYELSHIYWCDAKTKAIEMSRFDGTNRTTILATERSHMYDLTLLDQWIYWTDWIKRTVERVHKLTGNDLTIVIENLPDLMGLKAVRLSKPLLLLEQQQQQQQNNPCAKNNGNCSQICFNRPNSKQLQQQYICSCSDGYEMDSDQKTCSKLESYLILLRDKDLIKISLKTKSIEKIQIEQMMFKPSSFDLDIQENRIYWTDPKNKRIQRSYLNGTHTETIVSIGLENPKYLSLDWISKNLYWIDSDTKRLEVSRFNGNFRKILYYDLNRKPYQLLVDPLDGHLFWCDQSIITINSNSNNNNINRIIMSFLDGTKRKTIAESINGEFLSLIIDQNQKRLFWINSNDPNRIWSQSYLNFSSKLSYNLLLKNNYKPISLTLNDDYLFILEQQQQQQDYHQNNHLYHLEDNPTNIEANKKTIEIISKFNFSNKSLLFESTTEIDDLFSNVNQLKILDQIKQKGWNLCSDQNGGCEHLCLLKNFNSNKQQQQDFNLNLNNNNFCNCQTHFKLDSTNKKCLPPETFLLLSQKNLITRFLFDSEKSRGDYQDVVLPIEQQQNNNNNLKSIKAMAFDSLEYFLYFIDDKFIKRVSLINNNHNNNGHHQQQQNQIEIIISSSNNKLNMIQPIDLVLDPYSRLLFWTCNISNSINVTRIIGKPIMIGSVHYSTIDRPQLLAYHLGTNSLFWTNHLKPTPRIERITFPFQNKTTIIKDNIQDITSITIDQELNLLIWFDSIRNQIEYSSLEGLSRLILTNENTIHPIAMTAYDKYLFWIEKNQKIVEKLSLDPNHVKSKQTIFIKEQLLTDIISVPLIKKNSSYLHCNNENGGCSHFCFSTPFSTKSFVCDCPQDLMLANNNGNDDDQRNCIEKIQCKHPEEFQCNMGKCLKYSKQCNGIKDCPDGSDELNCPKCLKNELICLNQENFQLQCLDRKYFCDGYKNCFNGFDELCCEKNQFLCNSSNNCLKFNQFCDGKMDCLLGEDENLLDCSTTITNTKTATTTNLLKPIINLKNLNETANGNGQSTSTTTTSYYQIRTFSYSSIILVIFFTFVILFYFYYQCKRFHQKNKKSRIIIGGASGSGQDILMSERCSTNNNPITGSSSSTTGLICLNNRNPHKKFNGFLNLNNNNSSAAANNNNTTTTTNTLTTNTTTISGLDTLLLSPDILDDGGLITTTATNNNNKPTSSTTTTTANNNNASSLICQSNQSESLIERNVTGASSTSSSAAANNNYSQNSNRREAINPPPSPATERSQCSTLSSSLFVARRPTRHKMFGLNNNSKNNRKKGYKKKSSATNFINASTSNRCPPPTPYSTDVYDEPCSIKYIYYDNQQTDDLDEEDDEQQRIIGVGDCYEYKPPPPTPRNYFSDPSCPPSPVTERSYCNPYPPPPSPIQDFD